MAAPLLIVIALGAAAWFAVSSGLPDWAVLPGLAELPELAAPEASARLLVGVLPLWLGVAALVAGFALRLFRILRTPLADSACLAEGQRRSLAWIRPAGPEAPASRGEARLRRWRNLLLFRPLRRNSRLLLRKPEVSLAAPSQSFAPSSDQNSSGPAQAVPYPSGWLRLGAWLFHFSLLLVLLRHLCFWLDLPPLAWLAGLDGFFLLEGRALYLSDGFLLAALLFLLGRRCLNPLLRRVSRPADYFALFLLLALCLSGLGLRYFVDFDQAAAKTFWRGLLSFSPALSLDLPRLFYLHLFYLGLLLCFIPGSKLGHMFTAWLAPNWSGTLAPACAGSRRPRRQSTRAAEQGQSYAEYAAMFRPLMEEAGIAIEPVGCLGPVDSLDPAPEEPSGSAGPVRPANPPTWAGTGVE